eukprot:5593900-Pleurochrysis_carterae.AAC.2
MGAAGQVVGSTMRRCAHRWTDNHEHARHATHSCVQARAHAGRCAEDNLRSLFAQFPIFTSMRASPRSFTALFQRALAPGSAR